MQKIREKKIYLTVSAIIIAICLLPMVSIAKQGPMDSIKKRDNNVQTIINSKNGKALNKAEKEKLKELINNVVDFEALGQLALKNHWDTISEDNKKEFLSLFSSLIKTSSVKKLEIFKAEKISYVSEEIKENKAKVLIEGEEDDDTIEVVYHMHKKNDAWVIYDMVIDDISTVEDYRASFNKIINKDKFEGLLKKLRDKLEKEKKEN